MFKKICLVFCIFLIGLSCLICPSAAFATDVFSVPNTRQVCGHPLTSDITCSAADVGAVPTSRQVNGHALTGDVTVSKSDVGLGSVDNTADTDKPVSTVQATAIALKASSANPVISGTLVIGTPNPTDTLLMTQFDKTSSTALSDVTGLSLTLYPGYYSVRAKLYTQSNSSGGVKVALGGTATPAAIIYDGLTINSGTVTQGRATALGTAVAGVTAVTAADVEITGTINVTTAGTLTVQFAQNASNGSASSILPGSSFSVRQISNITSDGGYVSVGTQVNVTSNATLAQVPQLTLPVTSARTYKVSENLYTSSNSSGGIKIAIGSSDGATTTAVLYDTLIYSAGSITQGRGTALAASTGVTNTTAALIKVEGYITVNLGTVCVDDMTCTGRSIGVQFSQNASNGSASSILVGSTFQMIPQ
jgi:hypothetical protein